MTEIQDLPVPRHDAKLLLEDLACACGTLSEIMTAWRRAMPWRPELQLSSLTALQDTTRQLAAEIATSDCPGPRPDPALSMAARFSVIKAAIADARATICAPGTAEVGDRGLWELLSAAMQRADATRGPHPGPGRHRLTARPPTSRPFADGQPAPHADGPGAMPGRRLDDNDELASEFG
jgi:hypothetical protein